MDPNALALRLAQPIQDVGSAFYFVPGTVAHAERLGLNVYEFYGLGRGGVLGDVEVDEVAAVFHFFPLATVRFIWEAAKKKADPAATAREHVAAAYDFAHQTFGALDPVALERFARDARRVAEAAKGRYALVDGYLAMDRAGDAVGDAYLGAILLRELRGGVHVEAIKGVGLAANEACLLDDEGVFRLHGYGDDDLVEITDDLRAKKDRAEEITNAAMAGYLGVLDESERDALADTAGEMLAALGSPVAVTSPA